MLVTANKEKATEIDNDVITQILNMYPEENLIERTVFKEALERGTIEFKDLRNESDKILIPWQMFLLEPEILKRELSHIDKQRSDKISDKLFSKRKGEGDITSKRILDRLIRLQNFICENSQMSQNEYCGSLVGKKDNECIGHIVSYFEINLEIFRSKNKNEALAYLISKIQNKGINISQGVLANKMLPAWQVVGNELYKNTSGFVIKDEKVPFIFLPSEISPNEVDSRQIYTLIYLVFLIGLNEYDILIEKDFKAKAINAKGVQARLYKLTSELLLPSEHSDKLNGSDIDEALRDSLASKYKMSATAIVVTLRIRKIISAGQYKTLMPPEYVKNKNNSKQPMSSPAIENSVKKFCGKYSFDLVNTNIKNGTLTSVQAQYLLFGSVNKKNFKKYRMRLKI